MINQDVRLTMIQDVVLKFDLLSCDEASGGRYTLPKALDECRKVKFHFFLIQGIYASFGTDQLHCIIISTNVF